MIPKDAYPDVPRELLRRPRRNKAADQQAVIDALVAALDEIVGRADAGYFDGDTAEGAAAIEVGRAALAMARKGG